MQTDLKVEKRFDDECWNVLRGMTVVGAGRTKDAARRVRFELTKAEAKHGKGTIESQNAASKAIPENVPGWVW